MYAANFYFDGESLNDYGFIICQFDTSSRDVISNGSILEFNTVKPSNSKRFNYYGSSYNECLSFTVQIIRYDFETSNPIELTIDEINKIMRWLNRPDGYHKFKWCADGYENIYYEAMINIGRIEISKKCYGFELTINTNSPFGYLEIDNINFSIKEINGAYTINDISSETGYIYPYLEIIPKQSGRLTISNSMTKNHITEIKDCVSNEKIILDGEYQIIQSDTSTSTSSLAKRFNFRFPKIVNTYQNSANTFTFSIPCDVTIKYNPIVKAGV